MDQRWGRILWGKVVMDGHGKWQPGHYVCSSPILKSSSSTVHTRTGRAYSLTGEGNEFELPVTVLERLRDGISPQKLHLKLGESWRP
jgi:hypothetical protein